MKSDSSIYPGRDTAIFRGWRWRGTVQCRLFKEFNYLFYFLTLKFLEMLKNLKFFEKTIFTFSLGQISFSTNNPLPSRLHYLFNYDFLVKLNFRQEKIFGASGRILYHSEKRERERIIQIRIYIL